MAVFRPFRAYRPSKERQADIPALPYDVMSSDEARDFVKGNRYSFLHIDKAEIDLPEGTDIYSDEVYKKASENLQRLKDEGALVQDKKAYYYIYRQVMNGRTQTGIVGCASIDDYINDVIKKHEHTLEAKEKDRIRHVEACDSNTGPIFLAYRKNSELSSIIELWCASNEAEYDFISSDGVHNTVWVVTDDVAAKRICSLFSETKALYIADGHHRCASAVKVGLKKRQESPNYTGEEEFNFFLAVAFSAEELEIMDYNRVVSDTNSLSEEELLAEISKSFDVEKVQGRFKPSERHTFGMYINGKWFCLRAKQELINEDDPVERLDVSVLQNLLLSPVLNIKNPRNDKRIDFIGGIRGIEELERRAQSDMKIAFAMYPTTIGELMDIADAGKTMPPKSTWFEPKLLSGIFIHSLS